MSGPRIAWEFLKAFILINCGGMLFGIYLIEHSPPFWVAHWQWAWVPAVVAYIAIVKLFCWSIRNENGPERPLLTVSGAVFMPASILGLLFWAFGHVSIVADTALGLDNAVEQGPPSPGQ